MILLLEAVFKDRGIKGGDGIDKKVISQLHCTVIASLSPFPFLQFHHWEYFYFYFYFPLSPALFTNIYFMPCVSQRPDGSDGGVLVVCWGGARCRGWNPI